MPNAYFSFKQFTVWQDRCAMKVCTDACLLGAWAAYQVEAIEHAAADQQQINPIQHILDIGSGTGLLSLMLAQKSHAHIDAIEIAQGAFGQLNGNIAASPWHNRITAIHGDAVNYTFNRQYHLVICNPPFYVHHLSARGIPENQARHQAGATAEQLIKATVLQLAPNGRLMLLLPFFRTGEIIETAGRHGLHLCHQVSVRQTPQHDYFRSMLCFTLNSTISGFTSMYIRAGNVYSEAFTTLLKDYYLYL